MNVISSKEVRILKPRTCQWCWGKFDKGSKMKYSFCVDGGDNWSFYNCLTCGEIIQTHGEEISYGEGYEQGYVYEWMAALSFKGTPEEFLNHLNSEIKTI